MSYTALFERRALGIRLELETIGAVFRALGRPCGDVPAVHVVGTNGKGSVAAMTAHALRGLGHRVGLYTSPHLQRVGERVRIDGREVEDAVLEEAVAGVLAAEQGGLPRPLSFFEVITLAALRVFADAGVDVLVAEAGLGGRWDATRLVSARVVVVTSVGLDHTEWLGGSLEAIAGEKAGVFRAGVPVLTVEQTPSVLAVLRQHADEVRAPFSIVDPLPRAPLGLAGDHQRSNAALALAATRVFEPNAVLDDLDGVVWPGRLETHALGPGRVVFDVAHNVPAAEAIARALESEAPFEVLLGCQPDKDAVGIVRALARLGPIAWVPLEGETPPRHVPIAHVFAGPDDPAVLATLTATCARGGHVLVCGSHRLVGALRGRLLGDAHIDPGDPRHSGLRTA